MWKDLWRIISRSDTLLDEARGEALEMLDLAKDMFDFVVKAMVEVAHQDVLVKIAKMDRVLNEKQQEVRKKVFEHLATSHGHDLLMSLVLTSIVIDLERIGDYTKNIGEAVSFIPGKLDFGEYAERYESVLTRTRELFERTRSVFETWDAEAARDHVEFYHGLSRSVDWMLEEILRKGAPAEMVPKWVLGLAFMLRYVKRTAAHLKNICTAVSNPFPEIGYRPRKE